MKVRKGIVFVLAILIVCSFMPMSTEKVYSESGYGIWIGNVEVTQENKDNLTGEGLSGGISYDTETNTLTLNNAGINSGYVYYLNQDKYMGSYSAAGIYSNDTVNVVLIGNNSINPNVQLSGNYYYNKVQGIKAGNINFSGPGSIDITGYDYGISASDVAIDENTAVNVSADNGSSGPCTGVGAKSLTVSGELNANSRTVYQPSAGISAETINIGKTGKISAKAVSPNTSYDANSVRINKSAIIDGILSAGTMDYEYGIYGSDGATVTINSSGVLTAMGSKQAIANLTLSLTSANMLITSGDSESNAAETSLPEAGEQNYISIREQLKSEEPDSTPVSDTQEPSSEKPQGSQTDKTDTVDSSNTEGDSVDKTGTEGTAPGDGASDKSADISSEEPETTADPATQTGSDGTALGEGASAEAADAAIAAMTGDNDLPGAVFNKLQLRSSKQTNTSITLSWKKISGAKTYVIYGNKCGKANKMKRLAVSTGKSKKIAKVLGKKLNKGTYYKFMIVALDKNNNVVSSSKIIHVATKGGKVGNAGKVTTNARNNKVSIKKGKTFKLAGKQTAAVKKLKVKKHRAISYESTDSKIATVSGKGVIKGKKKGSCYVYAYSQNGVFAKIKVTVK